MSSPDADTAPMWEIVRDGESVVTEDHWLQLRDPSGWWDAHAKWDGCVEITRYSNEPRGEPGRNMDDDDTLHICDLDEAIARLIALRDLAREHFAREDAWAR